VKSRLATGFSATGFSASVPVLLLPARLETRFVTAEYGTELWVRIYPDQVHVNSHDPVLTTAETDDGSTYWAEVGKLVEGDDPVGPWRMLAIAHGPQRAAYIRLQTQPHFDTRPTAATAGAHPSPTATLFPSSWQVTVYIRGGAVRQATSYVFEGVPVREPPLFPDPNAPHDPTTGIVDPNLKWMVDFNTAEENGVAVRLRLEPADVAAGIERVVALGLCAGDSNAGAAAFGALIDDQHYTQGFAIVPQGSPTKNTPDTTAGFSNRDTTFVNSYRVEVKAGQAADPNGDGQVLAGGLGIDGSIFDSIDHSEGHDQMNARHMAAALWPSTVGYFLRQMMADVLDDTHVDLVRDFFLDKVRARGRLPAVRVGPVPYGVLPVTALNRWIQPNASAVERKVVELIAAVRPTWALSSLNTPRVGAGQDPDQALMGILGMEASSMDFHARAVLGDEFLWNWLDFLGFDFGQGSGWWLPHMQSADAAFNKIGLGQADAVIRRAGFLDGFGIALETVAATLSEVDGLDNTATLPDGTAGNYIQWIAEASIDDLAQEHWPGPGMAPTALLYKTLRASMLLEYSRASVNLLETAGLAPPGLLREIILHEIGNLHRGTNSWTSLELTLPWLPGGLSIKTYMQSPQAVTDARLSELHDFKADLAYLANLHTAELDRLLTETMDASSHRLDAWASALANAILDRNRDVHKRGLYVGGYGYVENLAPAAAPPSTTADVIPGALVRQAQTDNAGYVQAPSLQQAALAAVLRSGYLSHAKTGNADLLNLDISSDRVRRALWYLDGVRMGQKLGALLGYHFEESLHDASLDKFIQPFRDTYPLAVPVTDPSGNLPAGTTSAPNVVDGVALQDANAAHQLDVDGAWGPGLPSAHDDQVAVAAILADLDDVMNSISNVSVAESVFQVMRGNSVRASGLLDAASRGDWAPEPEFLDTRRTGIDISHRVLVVFSADGAIGANWPNPRSVRGALEPRVDDWCAKLLPDPATVNCTVHYTQNANQVSMPVSLKDLGVGPLDVLAMANAGTEPQHSELEQRILYQADLPAGTADAQIVFSNPGAGAISFPELLTAAAAVRDLVFGARGLQPNDLVAPEESDSKQEDLFIADLLKRADDTLAAIDTLEEKLAGHITTLAALLDPAATPTRAQLDAAASDVANDLLALLPYGAPGSVPLPRHRLDPTKAAGAIEIQALLEHATSADNATRKRVSIAQAYRDANLKSPRVAEVSSFFTKVVDGTVPALPRFQAKNSADLQFAFDPNRALVPAGQPDALDKWLQQLTYVRPPIARLDAALAAGKLLTTPPYAPAQAIGQLPKHADPDAWIALEFAKESRAPTRGRLSMLALLEPSPYQPAGTHSGLVIDEWPERIPQGKETSGLAFHYEEPKSRAPQCMLLAVAPNATVATWDTDTLRDIVIETFAWADLRTVDLDSLGDFGAILPALYFGLNTGLGGAPDAVSTDFGGIGTVPQ
jgi:hypothetical protein